MLLINETKLSYSSNFEELPVRNSVIHNCKISLLKRKEQKPPLCAVEELQFIWQSERWNAERKAAIGFFKLPNN
jgi:hypothetical protein